jgi:hypothetical protein
MTKELFIQSINAIEKQYLHDENCARMLGLVYSNLNVPDLLYNNQLIINQIIKILQIEMNDDNFHSWIEYYIHDLDFGTNRKLKAHRKDGSIIDLSDAAKLYDFLVENFTENIEVSKDTF